MSPVGQSVAHCVVKEVPTPAALTPASVANPKQHTWPAEHPAGPEQEMADPVHALEAVQPASGVGTWLWSPQQHTAGAAQAAINPNWPGQ
jgi:hypothetical protein